MRFRCSAASFVSIAVLLGASAALVAGPLSPPAGPIAPTPGPEPRIAINATNTPGDSDSLFKITQPGSYYLAGNITGVSGKSGIEIASSGVTVDLNGFDLDGVSGSLDGISLTFLSARNIAITNGSVRNWGSRGIDCRTANALNIRIDRVAANGNGLEGIYTDGASLITQCVSTFNGTIGIRVGSGSAVLDCVTRNNGTDGIYAGISCLIRGNSCYFNGQAGDGANIRVSSQYNRIENNNCTRADVGIQVEDIGNILIGNTCAANTINWSVVANNKCLVVLGVNSGVISGDAGGVSPGSTNPFANFTY